MRRDYLAGKPFLALKIGIVMIGIIVVFLNYDHIALYLESRQFNDGIRVTGEIVELNRPIGGRSATEAPFVLAEVKWQDPQGNTHQAEMRINDFGYLQDHRVKTIDLLLQLDDTSKAMPALMHRKTRKELREEAVKLYEECKSRLDVLREGVASVSSTKKKVNISRKIDALDSGLARTKNLIDENKMMFRLDGFVNGDILAKIDEIEEELYSESYVEEQPESIGDWPPLQESYVLKSMVILFSKPKANPPHKTLTPGTEVEVVLDRGEWVKVSSRWGEGWLKRDYLD
jgi:hypothetical protein